MSSYVTAYPPDYFTARQRFRSAAKALDATLEAFPIDARGPGGEELTIDAALIGPERPRRVLVLSTGLHGVEAFFGSAVLAAYLDEGLCGWRRPADAGLLLLHALNPYGYVWRRRANEDNVDLNRNFLLPGEPYSGSAELWRDLYHSFHPNKPPSRFNYWDSVRAALVVWRHGMQKLRNTIPVGQYDFPNGPFFGGHGPAQTNRILTTHLPRWLGAAEQVVHLDFHTGLGERASCKLLLDDTEQSAQAAWWLEHFGPDAVEPLAAARTAYPTRGGFLGWCRATFPHCRYHAATAEFGTYRPLKVLAALLGENRARFCSEDPCDPRYEWCRRRSYAVTPSTSERGARAA
jgi:hypothetical protein